MSVSLAFFYFILIICEFFKKYLKIAKILSIVYAIILYEKNYNKILPLRKGGMWRKFTQKLREAKFLNFAKIFSGKFLLPP